jgi:hypothetical protein
MALLAYACIVPSVYNCWTLSGVRLSSSISKQSNLSIMSYFYFPLISSHLYRSFVVVFSAVLLPFVQVVHCQDSINKHSFKYTQFDSWKCSFFFEFTGTWITFSGLSQNRHERDTCYDDILSICLHSVNHFNKFNSYHNFEGLCTQREKRVLP